MTILATAGGITVTVSPPDPNVVFDGSQSIQFTAIVNGTTNTAVSWSVDPYYGAIGQISSTGLFTPFGFNCANAPPTGVVRAVSAANAGAQGVTKVNLVPPTPAITGLSPQAADAETVLQLSGNFAVGSAFTALFPGPMERRSPVRSPRHLSTPSADLCRWGLPAGPCRFNKAAYPEPACSIPCSNRIRYRWWCFYRRRRQLGQGYWPLVRESNRCGRSRRTVATPFRDSLSSHLNVAIVDSGIYFVPATTEPGSSIQFLDFATNKILPVASFEKALNLGEAGGLAVSPDRKWLLYTRVDEGGE